tara:strand:- start:4684 stop:4914 length:231 start_codon:yes stop_codon:yes gene_type:complete
MSKQAVLVYQSENWGYDRKIIGAFSSMEDACFWIDMEKIRQEDEHDKMLLKDELYYPDDNPMYYTEVVKMFYQETK